MNRDAVLSTIACHMKKTTTISIIIVFEMHNEVLCHMFSDRRGHLQNDRHYQLQEAVVQNNFCSTGSGSIQKV